MQSVQGLWEVNLAFTYDKAGNRTVVEDNRGGVLTSAFDAGNRLTSRALEWDGIGGLKLNYDYNQFNQLKLIERFSDAAGTEFSGESTFGYDKLGQITSITHFDSVTDPGE